MNQEERDELIIRIDERVEELRQKTTGLPGRVLRLEIIVPLIAAATGISIGVF